MMSHSELLELAKHRFYNKNCFDDYDFQREMETFILMMYNNCDPASYGNQFVEKLARDAYENRRENKFSLYKTSSTGDLMITFKDMVMRVKETLKLFGLKTFKWVRSFNDVPKKYIEVKISYTNRNESYNIRHIRPHEDIDYFLLCFVDCYDSFKAKFVLVNKEIITKNGYITLTPMNGRKENNEENKNMEYGTSFKRNSWVEKNILNANLLEGTEYKDLFSFFDKMVVEELSTFPEGVKLAA